MFLLNSGAKKRAGALVLLTLLIFTACFAWMPSALAVPALPPDTVLPEPPEPPSLLSPLVVADVTGGSVETQYINEEPWMVRVMTPGTIDVTLPEAYKSYNTIYVKVPVGTSFKRWEPGRDVLLYDFTMDNETGKAYAITDYYLVVNSISGIQRTVLPGKDEEYTKELSPEKYWEELYKYYSDMPEYADFLGSSPLDMETLYKAIKAMTSGNNIQGANITAPDDLVELLQFYLLNICRLSLDQDNYPLTANEGTGSLPSDPLTLYSYLYKENSDLVLGEFLPAEVDANSFESQWSFCFDGPDMTNAYQAAGLKFDLILVLSSEPEPTPTPTPDPTTKPTPRPTPDYTPEYTTRPPVVTPTPTEPPVVPPNTGDAFTLVATILAIIAGFMLVIARIADRRRQRSTK